MMIHLRPESRSLFTRCGHRVTGRPAKSVADGHPVWTENDGYEPAESVCPGCQPPERTFVTPWPESLSSEALTAEVKTLAVVYSAIKHAGLSVPSSLRRSIERCIAAAEVQVQ